MRGEGLTDRPWDKPLTKEELERDAALAKAVEIIRTWPPKMAKQPASS
jgi:hypothetical protein